MRRGLMLLALALALGVIAARLTAGWLEREASARATGGEIETVEIIIAGTDLNPGDRLRAGMLQWQPWPVTALRPEHLVKGRADPAVYRNVMVQDHIVRGEPLLAAHLVPADGKGIMAALITPGLRAIAIPVSAASGIAGFVGPGDRVDIILTATLRQGGRILGQTVAENIRVLAIDQRVAPMDAAGQEGSGRFTAPTTVTLEVSPRNAEKISVAQELGRLSLVLRDLGSRQREGDAGIVEEGPGRIWDSDVTRLPADALSAPAGPAAMMMARRGVLPAAAPAAASQIPAGSGQTRVVAGGVQVVRGSRGDGTSLPGASRP